jgi:hypothetical protein
VLDIDVECKNKNVGHQRNGDDTGEQVSFQHQYVDEFFDGETAEASEIKNKKAQ